METATRKKTTKKSSRSLHSLELIRSHELQSELWRARRRNSLIIAILSSLIVILTVVMLLLGAFEILPSFLGEFSKVTAVAFAAILLGGIMGFYQWFRDRQLVKILDAQRVRAKKLYQ